MEATSKCMRQSHRHTKLGFELVFWFSVKIEVNGSNVESILVLCLLFGQYIYVLYTSKKKESQIISIELLQMFKIKHSSA